MGRSRQKVDKPIFRKIVAILRLRWCQSKILNLVIKQKNMFCPGDLGIKNTEVISLVLEKEDGGKEQKFTIKIKSAATLDMYALAYYLENNYPTSACADIETPRDKISCLEVLLKHFPALNYITVIEVCILNHS